MTNRLPLWLCVTGGSLMILGGLGDILIPAPPAAWSAVLGAPVADLPPQTAALLMTLLDALGGALVGSGIAVVALTLTALRRGERWAPWVVGAVALVAEGVNAFGMWRLGLSYFVAPLAFAGVVVLGCVLALVARGAVHVQAAEAA